MALNLKTLQAGQKVAVARYGSWNVSGQGVYVVAKADKMKIVLNRVGDGYERTFSVKRGVELPRTKGGYEDRNTFIETVEDMEKRQAAQQAIAHKNGLWRDLEGAVTSKKLTLAKELLAQLEALG